MGPGISGRPGWSRGWWGNLGHLVRGSDGWRPSCREGYCCLCSHWLWMLGLGCAEWREGGGREGGRGRGEER